MRKILFLKINIFRFPKTFSFLNNWFILTRISILENNIKDPFTFLQNSIFLQNFIFTYKQIYRTI